MTRRSSSDTAAAFLESQTKKQARRSRAVVRPAPRKPTAKRLLDTRPKHERMPITAEQIERLRLGAVATRDRVFTQVCERALKGETDALNACRAALYGLG